ncbi:hypothetical protein FNV43_RR20950 [Rhamnella rubrinervis]|uniref:starch synthase n=1 Tax=Rhamnella rubrinervis TaxID=2594499 RepID=A0A8K0GQY9_9ROSA|nr:hypothetical protein FNV43_RR20950 [Rhamnella rubrinervis]
MNLRRLPLDKHKGLSAYKLYSSKLQIQAHDCFSSEVSVEKGGNLADFGGKDLVWPSPSDEIPFWKKEFPSWDVSPKVPIEVNKDNEFMHIIHVTAELAPIAKVGGLGDVVTGLARACLSRGHRVGVMPFYECILKEQINDLTLITSYDSYHDGIWIPTNAYCGVVSGVTIILIEPSNQFFKGKVFMGFIQ